MAKGTIAKQNVQKMIQSAFGSNYIGEFDKKIYVWAEENGERVQIALSMTCPKNPVATNTIVAIVGDKMDFEAPAVVTTVATSFEPAEITDEERANVAALMARLGL